MAVHRAELYVGEGGWGWCRTIIISFIDLSLLTTGNLILNCIDFINDNLIVS